MSSELNKERFNALAKQWDSKPTRVEGAMIFVDKVINKLNKEIDNRTIKNFDLLDYGSGTGLVSFGFANKVNNIVGLDNSESMIKEYNRKANQIDLNNIQSRLHDINKEDLAPNSFDIVVTNMTMHHIKDIFMFVKKLKRSLKKDGFLFIADLAIEDGTFHSDNTGVEHFGFEVQSIIDVFKTCGFENVECEIFHTVKKPHKSFDLFIISGTNKEKI